MGLQRNGRNQKRDEDDTRKMEKRKIVERMNSLMESEEQKWKEIDTIILVKI
jgi:hypothetical protein